MNWLYATLLVGSVLLVACGEAAAAISGAPLTTKSLRAVAIVAVAGLAVVIGRRLAICRLAASYVQQNQSKAHASGAFLPIVLGVSFTIGLLAWTLTTSAAQDWFAVTRFQLPTMLAIFITSLMGLISPNHGTNTRNISPQEMAGSPVMIFSQRLLPFMIIAAMAALITKASTEGMIMQIALVSVALLQAQKDMVKLAQTRTAAGALARMAPETEAGFAAIARAARHLGTGACRVCMVLGALLVTSAAWPLLTGTGATRIVGGLGAALALVPFAAACLLAELARTPPVSSRSA